MTANIGLVTQNFMPARITMSRRQRLSCSPLVSIPGGEIWSHSRYGLVRIADCDRDRARAGLRVRPLPITRMAASIALARWTAAGLSGGVAEELDRLAAREPKEP